MRKHGQITIEIREKFRSGYSQQLGKTTAPELIVSEESI